MNDSKRLTFLPKKVWVDMLVSVFLGVWDNNSISNFGKDNLRFRENESNVNGN